MIVTIDGPAGAGKSTVARALAERMGFQYLDTGAMYRAVALAGMRRGLDWDRPEDMVALCRQLRIEGLRIDSRVQNRVQSRIRNRIDRYYDPQANAVSPFKVAGDQARTAGKPRGQ